MKSISQKIGLMTLRRPKIVTSPKSETDDANSEEKVKLRRVYTSEHMLSLRNQKYCLIKPANLPDLEIVLDVPHYDFNDSDAYVVSKENDHSFKEYLRVLIERGFDDTEFCGTFCQNIIALEPKNEGNSGFKSFLNTYVEIEFEKVVYVTYDIEGKEKQCEEAGDVRLKAQLQQQLTVSKHFYRIKLGISKLIGELYRIGVLNVKLIMRSIEKLLFIGGNESLESLYWLCYQITAKFRDECRDYVEKSGIQTDLFSLYVLKLNEYAMCLDLNADVRAKIEKLVQAANGFDPHLVATNGSGEKLITDEAILEATFELH